MSDPVWVSKDASGNINGVFTNPQSFPVTQTTSDNPAVIAFLNPPVLQTVLPQDLMAQFTAADMVKINAARATDTTGATDLLWYSMVAQRDPMVVTNARFTSGWSALVSVLGQARMNAIATALGATSLVV